MLSAALKRGGSAPVLGSLPSSTGYGTHLSASTNELAVEEFEMFEGEDADSAPR